MPKLQEQDLAGKVAIVTKIGAIPTRLKSIGYKLRGSEVSVLTSASGATKGIGRAIFIELATRGASVLGTFSSKESADLISDLRNEIYSLYTHVQKESELPLGPTLPWLVGTLTDITSPSAPHRILEALQDDFEGKVDIVVFNAAVMGLARMGEGTIDAGFVEKALAGNVTFPVLLMEELVKAGSFRPDGRVVAISSEGSRVKRPAGGAIYAATKAALECLMRKWADELGTRPGMEGTTFNSVSVGFTKTEAYSKIPTDVREKLTASDTAEVAVGNRIGEVEDIAGVVGLLVSEKARWISGSVVDGSGGKAKIL